METQSVNFHVGISSNTSKSQLLEIRGNLQRGNFPDRNLKFQFPLLETIGNSRCTFHVAEIKWKLKV